MYKKRVCKNTSGAPKKCAMHENESRIIRKNESKITKLMEGGHYIEYTQTTCAMNINQRQINDC